MGRAFSRLEVYRQDIPGLKGRIGKNPDTVAGNAALCALEAVDAAGREPPLASQKGENRSAGLLLGHRQYKLGHNLPPLRITYKLYNNVTLFSTRRIVQNWEMP